VVLPAAILVAANPEMADKAKIGVKASKRQDALAGILIPLRRSGGMRPFGGPRALAANTSSGVRPWPIWGGCKHRAKHQQRGGDLKARGGAASASSIR